MKPRHWISVWISLSLFVGFLALSSGQTSAAGGVNPAALLPWKISTLDGSSPARKVNVARGGSAQYPLLAISDGDPTAGYVHTDFLFPPVSMVGPCSASSSWICMPITDPRALTKASQMAVHNDAHSFKVSWLVNEQLSHWLTLNTYEFNNKLTLAQTSPLVEPVVDLNYMSMESDGTTVTLLDHSLPSLAFDPSGSPHMAFLLRSSVGRDTLWYAHKLAVGATPTRPCNNNPGTLYQCDSIVYGQTDHRLSSSVSIEFSSAGTPYLSFVMLDNPLNEMFLPANSLVIAYPAKLEKLHPNCGPEINFSDKSWRCTAIETSADTHQFIHANTLPQVEMAVGPGKPQFVYKTSTNGTSSPHLRYARYVGADGNCGEEYNSFGILALRWECADILLETESAPGFYDFDLKVDHLDYPVVAYTNISTYIHPYLMYPAGRAGSTSGVWIKTKLDGAAIDSGYGLGLSLSTSGLGLVGFVEQEDYGPNLKIAYQEGFKVFLPSLQR